jgi:hypothetical protein
MSLSKCLPTILSFQDILITPDPKTFKYTSVFCEDCQRSHKQLNFEGLFENKTQYQLIDKGVITAECPFLKLSVTLLENQVFDFNIDYLKPVLWNILKNEF